MVKWVSEVESKAKTLRRLKVNPVMKIDETYHSMFLMKKYLEEKKLETAKD